MSAILLGLINVAINVALLILLGLIIVWVFAWLAGTTIPQNIQKVYLIIVALIAIYGVAAIILGLPYGGYRWL